MVSLNADLMSLIIFLPRSGNWALMNSTASSYAPNIKNVAIMAMMVATKTLGTPFANDHTPPAAPVKILDISMDLIASVEAYLLSALSIAVRTLSGSEAVASIILFLIPSKYAGICFKLAPSQVAKFLM